MGKKESISIYLQYIYKNKKKNEMQQGTDPKT